MIRSVRCDRDSFKPVYFSSGFNVVLAERTMDSTKKDSRNGLGKSTLIEIIHFCLGASTRKGKGLLVDTLNDWSFYLDLTLKGNDVTVWRNTSEPSKIFFDSDSDFTDWSIVPRADRRTGQLYLSVGEWCTILGQLTFGLSDQTKQPKYNPTFRSLISYFIRRGNGAFLSPFEHFSKQPEWEKQVCNAYLLGLSWEDASELQILKEQEKALEQIKKVAETGIIKNMEDSLGELEATKVRMESAVSRYKEQLESFKVHPQYKEIEESANSLTAKIHELTNLNISDRKTLEFYQESLWTEKEPIKDRVVQIYEEAQLMLPGITLRRIDEVNEFHETVVLNRRNFLHAEIQTLTRKIEEREEAIRRITEERARYFEILKTHGALDEYSRLQEQHLNAFSRLKDVTVRIENLQKFEQGKSSLRIEREILQQRSQTDYLERREQRERAITFFNANSETLYSAPGQLIIDTTRNGFKFEVEIERSNSQGIRYMKVLCYDLMLSQLWRMKTPSPNILVHDSTIFDGVDERQIALALELACSEAHERGFQYICMMNSDTIPWDEFSEINLNDYVRLRLTDETENGSLLGIRF